jgi:N-acetylmuramoyl-L-alanine amidase
MRNTTTPGGFSVTILEGLLWLTLNIYHEARSEPQLGQIAIAHVTLNRAKKENLSIEDVVLQPHQFSWTLEKNSFFPKEPKAFLQCMESAMIALRDNDITKGATQFHQTGITPDWVSEYTFVEQIGSHKFYR